MGTKQPKPPQPEQVLVIPAATGRFPPSGFLRGAQEGLLCALDRESRFMDRAAAEVDPLHKQIIPYAVVTHEQRWLLYRRTTKSGESRLHDRFSLGIGGHINPVDGEAGRGNRIWAAMIRELNEEISLPAILGASVIGFINDNSNPVGRVHLGVVFRVEVAGSEMTVNEPDKIEATWAARPQVAAKYPKLEPWSRILWEQYGQWTVGAARVASCPQR